MLSIAAVNVREPRRNPFAYSCPFFFSSRNASEALHRVFYILHNHAAYPRDQSPQFEQRSLGRVAKYLRGRDKPPVVCSYTFAPRSAILSMDFNSLQQKSCTVACNRSFQWHRLLLQTQHRYSTVLVCFHISL